MSSFPSESRGVSKDGRRAHVSRIMKCVCFVWKGKLPVNWRVLGRVSRPFLDQGWEEMEEPQDWDEDCALCMVLSGGDRVFVTGNNVVC